MRGAESQDLGDWGEAKVRGAIDGSGFTVNKIEKDVGEDFLVEVGGRSAAATGTPPMLAYVQVKGHENFSGKERVERKHLVRWSLQHLPVFLITVAGHPGNPRFLIRAIDHYLEEHPDCLVPEQSQVTFSVEMHEAPDLAASLRKEIEKFYSTAAFNLDRLDDVAIANDHIEFLREPPESAPHGKVRLFYWKAIYKSPARPGNLNAVAQFIAKRARKHVGGDRASQIICFLYRSQAAMDANQWFTRVIVTETDHPRLPPIWSGRPAIELDPNPSALEVQRVIAEHTSDPVAFAEALGRLASRADDLATRVLTPGRTPAWQGSDVAELASLKRDWKATGFAPAGMSHIGRFFRSFLSSLDMHRSLVLDAVDESPAVIERWQADEKEKLLGYRGAVRLLLRQEFGTWS